MRMGTSSYGIVRKNQGGEYSSMTREINMYIYGMMGVPAIRGMFGIIRFSRRTSMLQLGPVVIQVGRGRGMGVGRSVWIDYESGSGIGVTPASLLPT